jgi:hypothetical protein
MTRHFIHRAIVLGTLALGALGCETHHGFLRPKDDGDRSTKTAQDDPATPTAVESDTSKIMGVDSDKDKPRPFFNSDYRSGGWSSQARAIERDLGVN